MIIGRFYFRQTNNGNLLGEFSNNVMSGNSTESADRIPGSLEINFIGNYNSTWFGHEAQFLHLNISPKRGTNETIFSLIWTDSNGNPNFRGEGFISDNLLIGNYWDNEVHNEIGNRLEQP